MSQTLAPVKMKKTKDRQQTRLNSQLACELVRCQDFCKYRAVVPQPGNISSYSHYTSDRDVVAGMKAGWSSSTAIGTPHPTAILAFFLVVWCCLFKMVPCQKNLHLEYVT